MDVVNLSLSLSLSLKLSTKAGLVNGYCAIMSKGRRQTQNPKMLDDLSRPVSNMIPQQRTDVGQK